MHPRRGAGSAGVPVPARPEAREGQGGGLRARRAGVPAPGRRAEDQAGAAGAGAARRREPAGLCLRGGRGCRVRGDGPPHAPGGAQQEERG